MRSIYFILVLVLLSINEFQAQTHDISKFKNTIQIKLDSIYNKDIDFGGATIGIILPDGIECGFAVGYANISKKTKMKPEDRMLGGSTGKIFVSTSIMQLADKGQLKLDDNISKYLGDLEWFDRLQNHERLTIRNLMQHTSGISRYVFVEQFQIDIHKNPDRKWQPSELISYVLDIEPLFETGTDFAYSDTNYILLAMILENVSKTTMYNYVDANILKPNKLTRISPQINRKIKGLVVGYNKQDDEFYPGIVIENGVYKYNVQFEWAGGGFIMNVMDLAKAGKLIYENKLFSTSLNQDFYNGIDAKQLGGKWGLGVHIKETPVGLSYGHSGFFPGYVTDMLYFPDYEFSIAIQVNTSEGKNLRLYGKIHRIIPVIIEELKQYD